MNFDGVKRRLDQLGNDPRWLWTPCGTESYNIARALHDECERLRGKIGRLESVIEMNSKSFKEQP